MDEKCGRIWKNKKPFYENSVHDPPWYSMPTFNL
jgi:hypothetical protein